MTTLYKPVLIETAERAEALPIGTVALLPSNGSFRQVLTKTTGGGPAPWELDTRGYANDRIIDWIALVPIEAKEGTDAVQTGAGHSYTRTRYVTPWESV